MAICGATWIAMISTISTAAQLSLPNWVRSRGLAIMLAVLMGSLAFGSIIWGSVAKYTGITNALTAAAIGAMIALIFSHRWHISGVENIDAWPADVHVIGKGILRFHAIFWPAFLLSAKRCDS